MIRGGHIDLSFWAPCRWPKNGDLANWMIPGKMVKGMGGAMDLVAGVKKVIVVMEHEAKGESKLLKRCNLPLTGSRVVDMVVTDLAVFTIDKTGNGGMKLIELADGVTEAEVHSKTEATFTIASKALNTLYIQKAGHDPTFSLIVAIAPAVQSTARDMLTAPLRRCSCACAARQTPRSRSCRSCQDAPSCLHHLPA